MKKFKYLFLTALTCSCFAQQPLPIEDKIEILPASGKEICVSTEITNNTTLFKNPGNNPIEILRRLGRFISPKWPENQSVVNFGTVFFEKYAGTPNFIKYFEVGDLDPKQQEVCNELIASHQDSFNDLLQEFAPSSKAISIKTVLNTKAIKESFAKVANSHQNASSAMSIDDIEKIQRYTLPVLEMMKDVYGVFSVSEKGMFGRTVVKAKDTADLSKLLSQNKLTIGKYIDETPLIAIAQTHRINDPAETMKSLSSIPNMAFINQMIASAGIDFEKDLLSNHTQESILYINLTPTGEHLIPDLRWVALVPEMDRLVALLPKLQKLCVQAGIFVTKLESKTKDFPVVKLSHCMVPQYGVYAALTDKFCILSITEEGALAAIKHLNSLDATTQKVNLEDCNFYCRINTSDLNVQLQQFLQSPLMAQQKIPPITNLTFLSDMEIIEFRTTMSEKIVKLILDIPFIKREENK